ncbi:Kelch repeat-containing protein [Chloroflexota bacterium]
MTGLGFFQKILLTLVSVLVTLLISCTQTTSPPSSPILRAGATSAIVDNTIYVFGGMNKERSMSVTETYDISTNTWTRKASMPTARATASATAVEKMIYVFGGRNESSVLDVVEVYDTTQDSWKRVKPLSFARWNQMAAAFEQKIYVFGGLTGVGDKRESINTVEIYDPIADSWSRGPSIPERKQGAAVAILQGKIYLAGGLIVSGGLGGAITNTVHVYDIATGKWDKAASMKIARTAAKATVIDGKIYVVGGAADSRPINSIEVYDPTVNLWEIKHSMQKPRSAHCVESVGRKIIIIGGMTSTSIDSMTVAIEEIDI